MNLNYNENDDNMSAGYEEGSGIDSDQSDSLDTDLDFSSDDSEDIQDYYDHMAKTKGYKDQGEMAKALYHANKHIDKIQNENGGMREWIKNAYPYLSVAQQAIMEKNLKTQGTTVEDLKAQQPNPNQTGQQSPKQNASDKQQQQQPYDPRVDDLNRRITTTEVNSALANMRNDKQNFPYMSKELENDMVETLRMSNQSFPMNQQGLMVLYNAAVGKNWNKIQDSIARKAREEAYQNILEKGIVPESERIGQAGKTKSADDAIINDIVNAGYGKSQF